MTAKAKKQPKSRSASFVAKSYEESQKRIPEVHFREIAENFSNTPLEDCLALLSPYLQAKELKVTKGRLQPKQATRTKVVDEDFDDVDWISWAVRASEEHKLREQGLAFVHVHNKYHSKVLWDEEDDHYTTIDGELLLISPKNPEQCIVISARGKSYVHIGSVGQMWDKVEETAMMSINGEPFWEDFDLPEWNANDSPDRDGYKTEEERAKKFHEVLTSTFPEANISLESANSIVNAVANYFAPENRPMGH